MIEALSKRGLRRGVVIGVAAPLLALVAGVIALRAGALEGVIDVLGTLSGGDLLALLIVNGVVFLIFPARWWIILRAQGARVPYLPAAGYRLAAFAVSYFTPGPQLGGEPLQAALIRRRHGLSGAVAGASVALDRALEVSVNFAVLGVGLIVALRAELLGPAAPGWRGVAIPVLGVALSALGLLALGVGARPLGWLSARLARHVNVRPRLARIAALAVEMEREMVAFCRQRPLAMLAALGASLLSWAAIIGELALMLHLLGFDLPPEAVLGILIAARLAFLLPSPGGLGTLEAGQALAFGAMGFDPAGGLALSAVIRARDVLFGALGLWLGAAAVSGRRKLDQDDGNG